MINEILANWPDAFFSWLPILLGLTKTPGIDRLKQRATQQNIEA
jgi:hypothetical protein